MASTPASRLLALLAFLQDRPFATGAELAEALEVDVRSVRRYAAALADLGYPVEGERGPGGGYRLRPGYRLPPLMFDDEEAAAVVLGLLAARRFGVATADGALEGALAKIRRVLPDAVRVRVDALEATLGFTHGAEAPVAPAGATVLRLADAARRRQRLRLRYAPHEGEPAPREVTPWGLVLHAGRWYLAAHDHDREALRTFRVDRVSAITRAAGGARPAPDRFDAVGHVSRALARVPWTHEVVVHLETTLEAARERIPPTLGELEPTPGGAGVVLRLRADSLDYAARLVAGVGCAFTIRRPPELRDAMRDLAARLAADAGR
jgi:predicted DNA-binding transcriptional regulator YafY